MQPHLALLAGFAVVDLATSAETFKTCSETFCDWLRRPTNVLSFVPETHQGLPNYGEYSGQLSTGLAWSLKTRASHVSLALGDPINRYETDDGSLPYKGELNTLATNSYRVHLAESEASISVEMTGRTILRLDRLQQGAEDSFALSFTFPEAESLYGIPEHTTSFRLPDTVNSEPFRLYNVDVFDYKLGSPAALYGSIPFLIAYTSTGRSVAIVWHNPSELWIDIGGKEARFMSATSDTEIFVLFGPTIRDLYSQLIAITGKPSLPPIWALGYHQCRWNYQDDSDVRMVDEEMDSFDFPYDTIWLDIDHTDSKKYFTWDRVKFPDPLGLQKHLADKGRHMVTIHDPHIKKDESFFLYEHAKQHDLFVKDPEGDRPYEGKCWSGLSSWIDFLNPEARRYWASLFSLNEQMAPNRHIWVDMNEPSVFESTEVTFPRTVQHYGGLSNRQVHNLYGNLMHEATYRGLLQRESPSERPFVLSRSFYLGSQQWGAIWTGDNAATWEHLQNTIPELLSLSVSGMPFVGADVGGFFGNPEEELLVRWYQMACLQPFFRAHAETTTKRREPYLLGKDSQGHVRDAIRLRYILMPYIYTLFWQNDKAPVMRPLLWHHPKYLAEERQFLIGESLLVAPVLEKTPDGGSHTQTIVLPEDSTWFDWQMGEYVPNSSGTYTLDVTMGSLPLFVKAGSIIPLKRRYRRSTASQSRDPYSLLVVLGTSEEATGTLFVDDTRTFDAEYTLSLFTFARNRLQNTVQKVGRYDVRIEEIRVWRIGEPPMVIRSPPLSTGKPWDVDIDALHRDTAIHPPVEGEAEDTWEEKQDL